MSHYPECEPGCKVSPTTAARHLPLCGSPDARRRTNMSRTIMTAAELSALPDGRYFDGTYEWDKEGDDWTPLRAPSGMPTQPTSVEARVTTVREPLHDPSAPAPAPSADAAEGLDEDGLTPVEQAVAKALWGRWAHPDPVNPVLLIEEDPRTVARFLRPFLATTPSATREEVADVVDGALIDAIYADTDMAVITQAADALLARFNITPKETDR